MVYHSDRQLLPVEFLAILKLIEEREKCQLQLHCQGDSLFWMHNEQGTALRILAKPVLPWLTIANVAFKYRRQGTMTCVLHKLLDFCERTGRTSIVCQSVATPEMAQFCLKNDFHCFNYMLASNDFFYGDYIYRIEI